jgi:hypothetical protein
VDGQDAALITYVIIIIIIIITYSYSDIFPQFPEPWRQKWEHFTDLFIQQLSEKTAHGKNFCNMH